MLRVPGIVASLMALALLSSCDDCEDSVVSEARNPSTGYVATFLERNCGATTDYVSHVVLRESGSDLSDADDVLVLDYQQSLTLTWTNPRELLIERIPRRVLGR
jgi:hypothetical protein